MGGEIGTTSVETSWLIAAFMVPRASLPLLLIKIRTQYGLRRCAEVGAVACVLSLVASFWMHDLASAVTVQFLAGVAAAPMSTLAFLYVLEAFPPARKMNVGLSLAPTLIMMGSPLAQIISPALIDTGLPRVFTLLSLGLALVCLALVVRLPLAPQPRAKVISLLDVVSYLFIAMGFGGLTIAFIVGTGYWWLAADWLGVLLAGSVAAVTVTVPMELNRKEPLLDIRWLTSPAVVHLTGALLVFRVVLSEQTSGAPGLFQQLGLGAAQMQMMYVVIVLAGIAGGAVCMVVLKPGREGRLHLVALALIAFDAWADSQVTVLTRPEQMYASRALIAFAAGMFLPPALLRGLMPALAKGPNYILSFVIVFLTTQSLGGVLGAAVFRSFVTPRETKRLAVLSDAIRPSDPLVPQRIGQIATSLAPQITDPTQRNAQAVASLAWDLTNQAYVQAYNDAFFVIFVISAGALALLSLHLALLAVHAQRTASAAVPA